ncbi:MAG: RNA polymerase sigma factor [Proteobacteria bacterium]|nr:RNA polymerase sigma factor [Pseudomonadota bacterium]
MSETLHFGQREWLLAYRVALRVLKVPDQAEDAAQEALMHAYASRQSFAGRSQPDSWLYRIAHNTAVTHLRKPFSRRYASADVFETMDQRSSGQPEPLSPERHAIASQLADRLRDCLEGLRKQDRVAFIERFLLGTSERELGQILGVSTNAAKQRAFRVRRAVRSRIAEVGLTP